MVTKQEYAQLALYVYNVTGLAANRPNLPSSDWEQLEYKPDNFFGFSYGIFRNTVTEEVVVSYTGTNEKQIVDFLVGNVPIGAGLSSLQVNAAALVAAKAINQYGSAKVSFTGHSLGAGLASIMAVWFDRPATAFDLAPFELTARNPLAVLSAKNYISFASGLSITALNNFEPLGNFSTREAAVKGYYLEGEVLEALRLIAPTIVGNNEKVSAGIGDFLGPIESIGLHSQALLTSMLMSENFRQASLLLPRLIPRVLDDKLYANSPATSPDRNFLIDILRSEQTTPGDGKLTHIAIDFNYLGTDLAGLNKAAQDALVAQTIEWYYWNQAFTKKQFFVPDAATGLLQYSSAQGEGSFAGAKNKAAQYLNTWLTPIYNAHSGFGGQTNFDQWNVATGAGTGISANAQDSAKTQIFIGGSGGDTLTGGTKADTLLAGSSDDQLNGGGGNDLLFGGADNDTYTFSGSFGNDIIQDSDGSGSIIIGTDTLNGGTKLADNVWESADRKYIYTVRGSNLIIGQRTQALAGTVSNTITVQTDEVGRPPHKIQRGNSIMRIMPPRWGITASTF